MPERSATATWLGLVLWIAVSFLPSLSATFVDVGPWYESLNRPSWTPPSWVFGPVWSTLYLLMGIAAWRVWEPDGFDDPVARRALVLYLVHLLFNAAWTILFFGLHWLTAAAVEIVVLWAMIVVLAVVFWRRDRLAGVMLVPYLLWVSYATTLSIGFAVMNAG